MRVPGIGNAEGFFSFGRDGKTLLYGTFQELRAKKYRDIRSWRGFSWALAHPVLIPPPHPPG
jgi:hypothetical protein